MGLVQVVITSVQESGPYYIVTLNNRDSRGMLQSDCHRAKVIPKKGDTLVAIDGTSADPIGTAKEIYINNTKII